MSTPRYYLVRYKITILLFLYRHPWQLLMAEAVLKRQFKQRLIFHGSVAAQPLNHLNISFCEIPHSTMFDRSV